MEKLLIFSDMHYPISSIKTISRILQIEKPDNILLLGDNIELEMFKKKELAYKNFLLRLNRIFPLSKSIIMLGDNDYTYVGSDKILSIIDSFSPINRGEYFLFRIGNMNFFHGNLEKSKLIEKIGYKFITKVNKVNEKFAPTILSHLVKFYFGIPKKEYLFLGHLHYLGKFDKTVFCGTLNYKAQYFSNSLGYVTVEHKGFNAHEDNIKLHKITTYIL
ncbi:MAG: hypothetical protein ACPLYE_00395 [Candidatus Micrarchaeales archaeon]